VQNYNLYSLLQDFFKLNFKLFFNWLKINKVRYEVFLIAAIFGVFLGVYLRNWAVIAGDLVSFPLYIVWNIAMFYSTRRVKLPKTVLDTFFAAFYCAKNTRTDVFDN
jgi:multisubunit Na+/H+ antiporter MnhE subunit